MQIINFNSIITINQSSKMISYYIDLIIIYKLLYDYYIKIVFSCSHEERIQFKTILNCLNWQTYFCALLKKL